MYLARSEHNRSTGIKELSASLGVSESYLSKIMSKLRQDGIVRAVPGVKGGYELAHPAGQITFLKVIQVIEGRQHLFECSNVNSQQHRLLAEEPADHTDKQQEDKKQRDRQQKEMQQKEMQQKDRQAEPEIKPGASECLVKQIMDGAERQLFQYLEEHTIQSVLDAAPPACGVHKM